MLHRAQRRALSAPRVRSDGRIRSVEFAHVDDDASAALAAIGPRAFSPASFETRRAADEDVRGPNHEPPAFSPALRSLVFSASARRVLALPGLSGFC